MHFEYLLSTVSVLWGSGYTITACVCIWIYNTQSFLWLVWSFHNLLLFLDTIAQPINSLLRLSLRTWYSNSAKASLRFKNNYFWSLTLCTRQVRHTEPQSLKHVTLSLLLLLVPNQEVSAETESNKEWNTSPPTFLSKPVCWSMWIRTLYFSERVILSAYKRFSSPVKCVESYF